jgi:cytochrome c oxidase subunit 2
LLNNRDTVLTDSLTAVLRKDLGSKERLLRLLTQMKSTHNVSMDKHVYDDIVQKDTLYLCVNKPYEFSFRSKDVIHSAYFPHFRTQMNTVPGYGTRMKFTPNKTTEEMRTIKNLPTFNYVLMCNKICGGAHYKMKLMVVVLEEAEYNAWMKGRAAKNFKATYFPAPAAPAATATPAKDTVKTAMN